METRDIKKALCFQRARILFVLSVLKNFFKHTFEVGCDYLSGPSFNMLSLYKMNEFAIFEQGNRWR